MAENERRRNEKEQEVNAPAATTMVGNSNDVGGSLGNGQEEKVTAAGTPTAVHATDVVAVENSSPDGGDGGSVLRPSNSDDAAAARMAELAAIAAVTGGDDDSTSSSSSSGGGGGGGEDDADPWSADLTADGIPSPPSSAPAANTAAATTATTASTASGPGVFNRLSSLRTTISTTASSAKSSVLSNPTVRQAQGRSWRENAGALVGGGLAMAKDELTKTVGGGGGEDDAADDGDSSDNDDSSAGSSSESGSDDDSSSRDTDTGGLGDEEDEYTSGAEGIMYSESQEVEAGGAAAVAAGAAASKSVVAEGGIKSRLDDGDNSRNANNDNEEERKMTEMEIEEELPMAKATTTSAASARWFSARRTALDSVATGFRGRYNDKPSTEQAGGTAAAAAMDETSASAAAAASAAETGFVDTVRAMDLGIVSISPNDDDNKTSPASPSPLHSPLLVPSPKPPVTIGPATGRQPPADPQADQVQRILSFGPEMDALMATLKPDQYPMLLGRGMLGVNLRQTYGQDQNGSGGLGSCGVYVDYVVPRGNADRSGVVRVGDRLVKVGEDSVVRGTIGDVPQRIAAMKRPGVLVLASGKELRGKGSEEDVCADGTLDWVDVSIGLINTLAGDVQERQLIQPKLDEVEGKKAVSGGEADGVDGTPIPLQRDVSLLDAEDTGDEEDSNDAEPLTDKEEAMEEGKSHAGPHGESPYNLVPRVGVTTSSYPSASVCEELVKLATKRANPFGSISSGTINSLFEDLEMMEENVDDTGGDQEMGDVMNLAKRMKDAFHNAFIHICLDPRSSPFLVAHMEFEDKKAVEARKQAVKEMGLPPSDVDEELDRRNSAAILLEYYLELLSHLVVMDATPAGRRTEIEIRLADSFRDLTTSNLLTDRDTLAEVKSTLDDMLVKGSAKKVDADFLAKLRIMTGKSIAVSPQFVTFLLGDQCARMRAYLHKTAPYVNVPLSPLVDGAISVRRSKTPSINGAHAHNHLLFAMLHLICRYEIDEDYEEAKQGFPIPEQDRRRIAGSAGGLACALFIRGTMLPCIDEAEKSLAERDSNGADRERQSKEEEEACYKSLIASCEQLWEAYVAPAGGILDDILFDDTERATCLVNDVRRALVAAISVGDRPKGVVEKATVSDDDRGLKVVRAVVSSTELKVSLSKLAEQLVHDYAVAIQPEFRKHMFHEWVCGEVQRWAQKEAKSPPDYSGTGDALSKGVYPLSNGSITRLMRRVELPKGVSQHRPQRIASTTSISTPPKIKADNHTAGQLPHSPQQNINAEYAIVFGNDEGMDSTGRVLDPSLAVDFGAVRRFACVKLRGQADEPSLDEDDIPPTLENYAVVPPIRELPFADIIDEGRLSTDGWEVSLVNFMVPNANPGAAETTDDAEGPFIYGVSLVFNQIVDDDGGDDQADDNGSDEALQYTTELDYIGPSCEEPTSPSKMDTDGSNNGFVTPSKGLNHQQVTFQSPITVSRPKNEDGGETSEVVRKIRVSAQTPEFNRRLREMRWSERVKKRKTSGGGGATVGIALVSGRNSIPAMRDTLSQLFDDYTNVGLNEDEASADLVGDHAQRVCDLLVDILGTLSQINVEREALNCILEPYIDYGSSQWIPRPLSEQSREFASTSGLELIQSLPPIPLALLFLTILLEQKIVLSSRRRSVIVSATMALRSMMNPLTWAHLFVPLVPASMAGDLIHYPAPFILGVPSEDEDSMVLLNSLPADVTLVDLDVGRVILARRLSNEEGMNAGMLRSQVLFLAETLGSVFGCKMQGPTWRCDSPLRRFSPTQGQALPPSAVGAGGTDHSKDWSEFAAIKQICKEFIVELLSGARSCCYWIEEKHPGRGTTDTHECSVLFDEDRFFSIKSLRSEGRYMPLLMGQQLFGSNTSSSDDLDEPIGRDTILALNPDDFDLVLEVFLRCQGMSTYISSRKKQSMAFH